MFWDNDMNADYDYRKLRKDLENEYMCQGIGFSGGFGAMQMMDASTASEQQLLRMAKEEGLDMEKYRK